MYNINKKSYLLDLTYASKDDIEPKSLSQVNSHSLPEKSDFDSLTFHNFNQKPTSENLLFLDVCSEIVFLLTSY